ncbi:molybdopterin molybdotransferase [Pedobacter sp. CAN_A7]|uniref:molybdopterin molybdotransferase MoeA n=1 Tax=Pedobacter sp. CAN_A7 TaxID=2787722 RepID=UPI0018CB5813
MHMTTVEQALNIISTKAMPFKKECIHLEEALGRILAEDLYADRDYPPFNRAAMDGYAIMESDWEKGIREFQVLEVIFTAQAANQVLVSGTCYKIMTGAATPASANIIIRIEDAIVFGKRVVLHSDKIKPYQNIARQGEDCSKGEMLLAAPSKCTPQVISLLATLGKVKLYVFKMPEVALITTGNEVVDPAAEVAPYQIRNSNQYLLKSLLAQWHIIPVLCVHVPDHQIELTNCLSEALHADLVIINGAVSGGDADYVPAVLEALGVETLFHKVSIRPGKPLLVGKKPFGPLVFALPGNPLSCLTTFQVFIEHYLYRCCSYAAAPAERLPLLANKTKRHSLTEYFPVSYEAPGGLNQLPNNGSADVRAVVTASGLAVQQALSPHINRHELITYYPFNP